jgi:hypothetical protein
LEGELKDLKKQFEKRTESLAECDELLAAEKKKNSIQASEMKKSKEEIARLKAQVVELKLALEAKEEARNTELTKAGYDAYREAVKSIKFLNPSIELNTRGLEPFHCVKDGKFLNFHNCHNLVLLDPNSMEPFNYDSPPPEVADEGEAEGSEVADGGAEA